MAGILFNLVYLFGSRFYSQAAKLVHPWNIPLPPVHHKVLEKELIDRFDEILVIGDVHGCFDELRECLNTVHANTTTKILKIFVGDLINKGEKSKEVLNYVMNEGKNECFSIRGNHEEKVLREYGKHHEDKKYTQYYSWIKDITTEEIEFISSLPYTIRLPTLNVIIVHAGLIPKLSLDQNQPFEMVNMRNVMIENGNMTASRDHKVGESWASKWTGPDHVYFGHDARRKFQRHQFATGLDTGCVYGGQLTSVFIKGPRKGNIITVKAKKVYEKPGDD
ncbi:bis(5'-nucleosyl)-tetraphosphatase PrpE [asymmetrical]-like [Brevipalpus obovatus]|uniref:bis(5'-nucleosyl)-tetraphosphatase PrpE [asymmetrical]-like n=1 Tax=Brevipalpus obovatus TaxID=246614 RepID=UPI003D9FA183